MMRGNAESQPDEDFKGWEPDRGRWTRMYKGVRFRRTPEQLGLPVEDWTAARSHSAWLEWLRSAIKHFDSTGEVLPPPKKLRVPYSRPSKRKFIPWRDDPDYPTEYSGRGGLPELHEYSRMLNLGGTERDRILEGLRCQSRNAAEFQEYLGLLKRVCGVRRTLEDRRYYNEVAEDLLGHAKTLNEIRKYAKVSNELIHEAVRRMNIGWCQTLQSTDDLREFGWGLMKMLEYVKSTFGTEPPSYRGWEGPPRFRWTRMHKGIRFRMTCEQLGLPKEQWNARDSQEAWLAWFQNKLNLLNQPGSEIEADTHRASD